MYEDIQRHCHIRSSVDSTSPRQGKVYEALMYSSYRITEPLDNAPNVAFDRRWAIANVLHFFCGTERAEPLLQYNEREAKKFLTPYPSTGEYIWHGAYGARAMPRLRGCIQLLNYDRDTRRAIVGMHNNVDYRTINTPHCWSLLQFLSDGEKLHMGVSQRSLSMRVMPYDAVLLSNILCYVADHTQHVVGSIAWTVGSLHATDVTVPGYALQSPIHLPMEVLDNPAVCWNLLLNEALWTMH